MLPLVPPVIPPEPPVPIKLYEPVIWLACVPPISLGPSAELVFPATMVLLIVTVPVGL